MIPKNFPNRRKARREEAEKRQMERNKRSNTEQLKHLDATFGIDVGAKKERERLQKDKK